MTCLHHSLLRHPSRTSRSRAGSVLPIVVAFAARLAPGRFRHVLQSREYVGVLPVPSLLVTECSRSFLDKS